MQYLGSKRITGKRIVDYMFTHVSGTMPFIELFVGGLNYTNHVCHRINEPQMFDTYKVSAFCLNEFNEYLVALIMAYKAGWTIYDYDTPEIKQHPCIYYNVPIKGKRISVELWNDVKKNPQKYPPEVVGFCGVGLSFANNWFRSYPRCIEGDNYTRQFHTSLLSDVPKWNHWQNISSHSYQDVQLPPPPAVLYCDPPYRKTEKCYRDLIDHDVFDDWLVAKHKQGYHVFISEYIMPEDRFKVVLQFDHQVNISTFRENAKSRVEKLYMVRD